MTEGRDEKDDRGFVVIDRRGRSDEEQQTGEAEEKAARPEPEARPTPRPGEPGVPKVDFSMLILSVSHSAFYHLGLVEDPTTQQTPPVDKVLARSDIDMLEILQEKTRGNLTPEEDKLLQSLLYDLRMRFVEAE
jgi:hypothetical protein